MEPLSLVRAAIGPPARPGSRSRFASPHAGGDGGRSAAGGLARGVAFVRRCRHWPAGWKYARRARYIAVSEFVKSVLVGPRRAGGEDRRGLRRRAAAGLSAPAEGPLRMVAPANADDPRKGAALALEAARLAGVELRFSDKLERDLAGAALFLYITHSEGLGSGALLAMSAGVPVLASRVGGLPEVVRHGENGWLVENTRGSHRRGHPSVWRRPGLTRRLGAAGAADR